jgi:hypothetical protein
MTDWKLKACALGIELPDEELERTVAPLAKLEPVFAKLASSLTPEIELAPVFDAAGEESPQ